MSSVDYIGSLVQSAKRLGNGLHPGIVNFIFMDLVQYISLKGVDNDPIVSHVATVEQFVNVYKETNGPKQFEERCLCNIEVFYRIPCNILLPQDAVTD